jgi:K+-sensing histidine kinase KdpD
MTSIPDDLVEREWRCFHCDQVFTTERCARLHFGPDEDSVAACVIKAGAEQGLVGALRDAEKAAADAWHAVHNETTDAAKAYYAQSTRHHQQLRLAEEAGYERGLADARELAQAQS